jgi:hypothetical protein
MTRPGETVLEYREPLEDDDQLARELRERSAEVLCVAAVWGAVLIAVVALLTLAVLTVVFD